MIVLNFYRMLCSIFLGGVVYFLFWAKWWIWIVTSFAIRIIWFFIEKNIDHLHINTLFKQHESLFKQLYGPYGIRVINKAGTDWQTKKSLAEVFTNNKKNLTSAVEQLEVMNTLFQAGLKPDGDSYLLHDLKLKYGKYRLEKMTDRIESNK